MTVPSPTRRIAATGRPLTEVGVVAGDGRLHVTGAGARIAHRLPVRHLQLRHGVVRDARRTTAVSRRHDGRYLVGDSARGSAGADAGRAACRPQLERIIRRCLEKAPSNRFQSADDLAFALEAVTLTPSAADGCGRCSRQRVQGCSCPSSRPLSPWRQSPWQRRGTRTRRRVDPGAYRFTPFATEAETSNDPAWSPDGRSIAYDMSVNGRSQIFVRSLDSDSPAQITHGCR